MGVQAPDLSLPTLLAPSRSARLAALEIYGPLAVLVLVVGACFFGPILVSIPGPNSGVLSDARLPPLSSGHLFGTDALGNDLLSRCLYGGRVSIEVGLGSVAIGLLIGGLLGILAGFKGGGLDSVIMRILDMFLGFPPLVLALAVAAYLGPSERDVIFAIAFFTVPAYARLARANTLRLREQSFMVAAKLIGGRDRHVLTRHVLPNVLPSLATFGLLTVAVAMIIEAALDFLGLGVRPPQPSWGSMISAGQTYLSNAPWIVLIPSAFLFVTVSALNLFGDALRTRWETA